MWFPPARSGQQVVICWCCWWWVKQKEQVLLVIRKKTDVKLKNSDTTSHKILGYWSITRGYWWHILLCRYIQASSGFFLLVCDILYTECSCWPFFASILKVDYAVVHVVHMRRKTWKKYCKIQVLWPLQYFLFKFWQLKNFIGWNTSTKRYTCAKCHIVNCLKLDPENYVTDVESQNQKGSTAKNATNSKILTWFHPWWN